MTPFRTIHTSLAPTVSRRDVWTAATLLAHPRSWLTGTEGSPLEKALSERLGGARVRAFDSGRNALRLALAALGIGRGDEVLLQAYTCVSVPGPVLWARARPVYVDIRPDTLAMDWEDLERKITPRARAVIVQHTFGLPADLDEILATARRHGLAVIEDCAHALGATYRGKPVGTFGDAAIFSFGRDKVISSVFGGALVLRNWKLETRDWKLETPPMRWVGQQLLHSLLVGGIVRPSYSVGGRYLFRALQAFGLLSKALTAEEKRGGEPPRPPSHLPNALAALARSQLARLDDFLERRQSLAKHYAESLQDLRQIALPVVPPGRTHGFLRYAVRVPDPQGLHAAARRAGVILGDWYDAVVAPRDTDLRAVGYAPGSCPRAEQAARESVNLPTSPIIGVPEADRVLRVVRQIYR